VDISEPLSLIEFQDRNKTAKEISLQMQARALKIFGWF
jgi:hypothetical protein